MTATDALAQRYGRAPRNSRRTRWRVLGGGAAALAVFAGWLVWSGSATSPGNLVVTDTAHTIVDDHHVSVSFEVSADPGSRVSCAVQALNEQFAVVGWKIVSLPASSTSTRNLTESVRTTELSNTGLISRCWLT